VLVLAQHEAHLLKHDHFGTEHFLIGLIQVEHGVAAEVLTSLDVTLEAVRQAVLEITPMGEEDTTGASPLTADLKKTLELALRETLHLGQTSIGTEHLLLGLLRNGDSVGTKLLSRLVGDLNRVLQQLIERMSWYTGRVVEENGVKKPIMENPNIRPLGADHTGPREPKVRKLPVRTPTSNAQRRQVRHPDDRQLMVDGIDVLEGGLLSQPSPLAVITPEDAELPHHYGGRIQILSIERFEGKVVVERRITLEPDPDVELAEQLEALDREPDEAWTLERIEQHVQLVDVLKLTVFFSRLTLTDDLGTAYQEQGGGGSTGQGESTWHHDFEPAIPDEATTLTVHWEDLTFEVPLR